MSQENSRFASMLNVNGTTYAYYPVSAVAGSVLELITMIIQQIFIFGITWD